MPKSPKEMGEAIARNLPAKTGRTFEQWVALLKKDGPDNRKAVSYTHLICFAAWLNDHLSRA